MSELPIVDHTNPWPGLGSYGEASSPWFHGRAEEAASLQRLVEREPLTVLYGRSGLGKTSLVQAGLFPRLRQADYLPVRVHLVLAEDAPPLRHQVCDALTRECQAHNIDAKPYDENQPLWAYFHLKDGEFWSRDDRLITPVLVFDQFEEIFTLGRENPSRRERCDALLAEIGDLVENRRPQSIRDAIDADPLEGGRYDERRGSPRVLLSFREDYLADFDILYDYLRARTSNRLRLLPLTGNTAQAAVLAASPDLVTEAAASRIIDFIDSSGRPLADRVIEPALLSLVCHRLNERRLREGFGQIDAAWLADGSAHSILVDFYESAFAGLDSRVKKFVEDHLLTASGYRDSCALDNALDSPGVDTASVQALTDRRLLRREDRGGQVRVELIHDVLAPIARNSRDRRREQERLVARRRRQRVVASVFVGLVGVVVALSFLTWKTMQAEQKQRQFVEVLQNLSPRLARYSEQRDLAFPVRSVLQFALTRFDEMLGKATPSTNRLGDPKIAETDQGFRVGNDTYSTGEWSPELRARLLGQYPDLIRLILTSESINQREKQQWFDLLPRMTDAQVERLFAILATERGQLNELNEKYSGEIASLNEKHRLEWFHLQRGKNPGERDVLEIKAAQELIQQIEKQVKAGTVKPADAVEMLRDIAQSLADRAGVQPGAYEQLSSANDHVRAYLKNPADNVELLKIAEHSLQASRAAYAGGLASAWQVSDNLLSASWHQLMLKRYSDAEKTSKEALAYSPRYLAAETNLAHALALMGRSQEAQAIYLRNVGSKVYLGGRALAWEDEILNDFQSLRKAGIDAPLFSEISELISKAKAKRAQSGAGR